MKGYTIQNSIDLLEKAVKEGGGSGGPTTAESVTYDNTTSHLTADDVQEAIDEVVGDVNTLDGKVTALEGASKGVFFDSTNVIQAKTTINQSATYTATEDCFVHCDLIIPASSAASVVCDNVELFSLYVSALQSYMLMFFIPAGKTVTINGGSSGQSVSSYTVYGIYEPTPATTRKKKK